jgi:hypothetical protein
VRLGGRCQAVRPRALWRSEQADESLPRQPKASVKHRVRPTRCADAILTVKYRPCQFPHEQLAAVSPDLLRTILATFINTFDVGGDDAICGELSPEGAQRLLARELATRAGYS